MGRPTGWLATASAAVYGGIGVGALVRPELVLAVFGGTAATAAARTEVRAVYGGFPLALAGTIGWAMRQPTQRRSALQTAATVSAGMAGARLAGAVLERRLPAWPTGFFLVLEAALASALFRAATGLAAEARTSA